MTVRVSLPSNSERIVAEEAEAWRAEDVLERFWRKDPTVWADPPVPEIADRLGWLDAPVNSRSLIRDIESLHSDAIKNGITDIVLLGMGGSSLAPEVFASSLPLASTSPKLTVVDSTHPAAVLGAASVTDPASTWYIVASKSGGTIETMSLFRYFWKLAVERVPDPGSHFIAITDPGTSLEVLAADRDFRATVIADPNVGGRYSALTAFGLVPTGLIGGDVSRLLESAERAALLCRPPTPLETNPGFGIGVVLANRAKKGHDKAQFLSMPPVETIGIWIEQLVAESTGKMDIGIVPIDGGPRLAGDPDATVVAIGDLPDLRADIEISVDDPYDVAGVIYVLEFATAVVGRCLAINPFDQPDVEIAKKLATSAMGGSLGIDDAPPVHVSDPSWVESVRSSLHEASPTYISLQGYIPQTEAAMNRLDEIRILLSDKYQTYVTVGIGPRFLHSTGQLHKGGPSGALYLQIVSDTGDTLNVPETDYSFNELITAQARGDRAALVERGRTVVAVNIGNDIESGLATLVEQLTANS
jgi:transaldolase/glucose-6-phosphate isomerase